MVVRIERRHSLSRRCLPIPEPALLQAMVAVQRIVRRYTRTLEEICCLGLVYSIILLLYLTRAFRCNATCINVSLH